MNGRTFARVLLAIVLILGAVGLAVAAYDAGVTAGLAQNGQVVVPNGGVVAPVAPYVGYGYGYGWGHGFGFFGIFGGILFLFLIFALVRAAFGPRRGWGPGRGWGAGDARYAWEDRARDIHDAWHRDYADATDRPDRSDRPTAG